MYEGSRERIGSMCAATDGAILTCSGVVNAGGALDVHLGNVHTSSKHLVRPTIPNLRVGGLCKRHSNCKTCRSVRNPRTYQTIRHGPFPRVALAPPLISPLCWRKRRRRSLVLPMYVFVLDLIM